QDQVTLGAEGGLLVRPDGDGGAEISGSPSWTITLRDGHRAELREWTVVARLPAEDDAAARAAVATWKSRGHAPPTFEVGSVFAVAGSVMDSREVLVAIDPVGPGRGEARARILGRKHGVNTTVHVELAARPRGTIVARSGSTTVQNPSVLWFEPSRRDRPLVVRDVVTGGGGSQLATGREDRHYAGRIYVAVGIDGKLTVVNAIGAEKLLAGLVP